MLTEVCDPHLGLHRKRVRTERDDELCHCEQRNLCVDAAGRAGVDEHH